MDPPPASSPEAHGRRARSQTISDKLHAHFESQDGQALQAHVRRQRFGTISNGSLDNSPNNSPRPDAVTRTRAATVSHRLRSDSLSNQGRPITFSSQGKRRATADFSALEQGLATEEHRTAQHVDEADLLQVVDPQASTAAHFSNISNSIAMPPLPFINRAPVVQLDDATSSTESLAKNDLEAHIIGISKRREFIRRSLQGFWAFAKTPAGVFFVFYGINVVFWGAALVLILAGALHMKKHTQDMWVEYCSQILNGLFTITGVLIIPWRAADTWNISIIYSYQRKIRERRAARGLGALQDRNEVQSHRQQLREKEAASRTVSRLSSTPSLNEEADNSASSEEEWVLSEEEEARLYKAEKRFVKSQTWFRPHATATHHAFRISWALMICCLVDMNSLFQCMLCGVMWGLSRTERPAWTTGSLIPLSFSCGIAAAVLIYMGGKKCKKQVEVDKAVADILVSEGKHAE